ncbi:hypothetical protein [Pannonibacter tanglangensis]|uniref:Minor tail protein Z (GPZ) n=1 Tax=Pannonibacter tanglangensis TaxID=2750084 RepID=A0ABW9ZFN1_9HYPH|nr:hypothetical protein [Pannonibacter sp. XCT-34]NBN62797.1 hypothetical protein [Pannonibacter sp. XCT-34]
MTDLRITWDNIEDLRRFHEAVQQIGSNAMAQIAPRAINRAGSMARTRVIRALAKQTGLKQKVIRKAVRTRSAWGSDYGASYDYELITSGGEIDLKHFDPREVEGGTMAKPFGRQTMYPDAFMRGGVFPTHRVALRKVKGVVVRKTDARMPIMKAHSGVWIPKEMVQGETAQAFASTVAEVLPRRLAHEMNRLTGGVIT